MSAIRVRQRDRWLACALTVANLRSKSFESRCNLIVDVGLPFHGAISTTSSRGNSNSEITLHFAAFDNVLRGISLMVVDASDAAGDMIAKATREKAEREVRMTAQESKRVYSSKGTTKANAGEHRRSEENLDLASDGNKTETKSYPNACSPRNLEVPSIKGKSSGRALDSQSQTDTPQSSNGEATSAASLPEMYSSATPDVPNRPSGRQHLPARPRIPAEFRWPTTSSSPAAALKEVVASPSQGLSPSSQRSSPQACGACDASLIRLSRW